ncbi:MAG: hypothetical protein AAB545_03265 [Patescibacteria group bacterium]
MSKRTSYLRNGIILLFALLLLFFGYLKTKNVFEGPSITIQSPRNGEATTSPLVTIKGVAKNIAHLSLNDRQIYLDQNGVLEEKLLLAEGYNILTLKARDKFGKTTENRIELVYKK